MNNVTFFFTTNVGKAFSGSKIVAEGTSLSEFFEREMPGQNMENYRVTVNRELPENGMDYILQNGDRLTVSPTKIDAGV